MKILFWLLVAVDALALGVMFVLGLAFAGPSHTYIGSVVGFFLLPFVLLVAAAAIFLFAKSPLLRGVAFLLAAVPVLVVGAGLASGNFTQRAHTDAEGNFHDHVEGPERELDKAIKADDLDAVRAALRRADVKKAGMSGVSPLTKALDKLMETKGDGAVLRELLAAGANPNADRGSSLAPLERAIGMTRSGGTEPLLLLLKAGAQPNAKVSMDTPAFFAATGKGINVSVMQILVDHGANLRMADAQGHNAVAQAINTQNWPMVLYLLQQGVPARAGTLERLERELGTFGDSGGLAGAIAFVKKSPTGQR